MSPDEFISQRRAAWERLNDLLRQTQQGALSKLSERDLLELGSLYRAVTSDLALVQRDYPNHALAQYLNQLVGRAHPIIYRGEPLIARRLRDFYSRDFPRLYRELAPFLIAAMLLFFGSAIALYFITQAEPDTAHYLLSPRMIEYIKSGKPWWKSLNDMNNVGSALIMSNNLRVSFFAYAGGMLMGFITLYILIMNGLDLGMVFGLLQYYGHAAPLAEFVIGHGVLELSEIVMAGAAGLTLPYAILHPGLLSRKDALIVAAQKSVRLLLGSAPLLIIAGVIEGMISPSDVIPAFIKYGIGIASGVLLYAYLLFVGRERKRKQQMADHV